MLHYYAGPLDDRAGLAVVWCRIFRLSGHVVCNSVVKAMLYCYAPPLIGGALSDDAV